ncbi:hypothetical protein EYF80_044735 [Liparis tanakae]|uniref:Uncharacterized protein n=1 Tax=Liparis tanakae TaxID=230148 RepID=A0A4Z2FX01_9TELE|nr:hypothetical protein EYF80_044735 [Liparis tanakae]
MFVYFLPFLCPGATVPRRPLRPEVKRTPRIRLPEDVLRDATTERRDEKMIDPHERSGLPARTFSG